MSDFDMVGPPSGGLFYASLCRRFKGPRGALLPWQIAVIRKNHFYCIDLTPFFKIITRYFSAEEGMILTAISYLKMKR
ncbi:Uncharacterised protein [Raoultella ornithinolytica]|nr:Uncharacterised protein [Raoultella ornithinolytica]